MTGPDVPVTIGLLAHPRRRGQNMSESPNIVLVHGAWADGSSWSAVVERLQADGYSVVAPQFPETSLADDVARAAPGPKPSEQSDDRRRTLLRRADHDRAR